MKNASIICFIGLLVLVIFVSGCNSKNTTSNQSGDVRVQINSNDQWNGTLKHNGVDYNISGGSNIEKNYNLGPNPGHVEIYIKKFDDKGNLTARLLQGTKVIETQSISLRRDAVNISHDF